MSIPFRIVLDENKAIRGDFYPAASISRGVLIISHGFKGFKDWGMFPYAAERLAKDVDVITFNFTHNGVGEDGETFSELDKFAKNTYSCELDDLSTLISVLTDEFDFKNKLLSSDKMQPVIFYPNHSRGLNLLNTGPDHAGSANPLSKLPFFLLGHSRGAGVSLIYALDHPSEIAGVISWNGITQVDIFDEATKKKMRKEGRAYLTNSRTNQEMPLDKVILDDIEARQADYNIVERMRGAQFPVVLIQGEEDYAHLRKGSKKLVDSNSCVSWIQVPGGNHTFGAVHPFQGTTDALEKAIEHTLEFLRQRVVPTA
ncbi:S9 family peptidase [Paenibacillus sp. FJAT-26967]|uniref:alpha/beta hydrolase family protein n=1 Tax=Paenibacillus sp. FJAT-26967 TaxID=1729690 RepID=UPI000838017D|nr:lysophospholipase [Paenibacillus sp. FJAT-26967]